MMMTALLTVGILVSLGVSIAVFFQISGMARAATDTRLEIAEKLNEKFSFIGKELREELSRGTQTLETKFTSLEGRVNERLEKIGTNVEAKLDKNIKEGFSHFQKVQETLAGAEKQLAALGGIGQSIHELNSVLNLPHLRGKLIGEGSLERLLADFLPAGYFERQFAIEGALVDFVVKFPELGMVLPIDSKFSLEQVSALFDGAADPEALKLARRRLSELAKANGRDIRNKYIKPRLGTTEYALMYLPSETLYFEIVRDTDLWNALAEMKVYPVSPNTLAISINAIGSAVRYHQMSLGVKDTIRKIQLTRNHLEDFKNRFEDIGEKLIKAQDSFGKANTHLGNYTSSIEKLVSAEEE
ncbi:MAG: DNA recombination protein RmuC [Deltaproteobacteria bacterium]|nr:DNA recombination protein RmuC [Deltaproteobacteria bacterium]